MCQVSGHSRASYNRKNNYETKAQDFDQRLTSKVSDCRCAGQEKIVPLVSKFGPNGRLVQYRFDLRGKRHTVTNDDLDPITGNKEEFGKVLESSAWLGLWIETLPTRDRHRHLTSAPPRKKCETNLTCSP